ncbi:hypothetical protein B0A58_03895 [Flavobacterium branchiophilum NBRC 15030 = ATCC 35035]|uniref:Uncharacterized protein n=1 Tax=Flavobacterium branchiophilum TaxID=55197 RepID=A0A543G2B5_9FLAO|nr:hypothetical protein [Flavobacterium branchiophilum]OXA79282.1 hypothetical protein B0A58_03895 [Flavobacterium branchiophilum NBRC 15030 = ATCC 35035]TQM40243.1 hypothetical protein BC670_1119 [Flavobacterium branchiophilum]
MKYFILKNKEMPWGDYGDILFSGLLTVMDENFNDIEIHKIERVGINIPEIYTANSTNLVISQDIMGLISVNKIKGVKKYHDTKLIKIVNLDWENWDFKANDPFIYPKNGEPYNYIEEGLHDENLKTQIKKKYYSLDLETQPRVIFKDEMKKIKILNYTPKFDLFKAGKGYIIASENFKRLIEINNIEDLVFIKIDVEL